MSIYTRHTFLFLVSMLILSYGRESTVLVTDVASIRYRGDQATLHLSLGNGEWTLESQKGISLIFSRGDGTVISYCPFGCEIWGTLSSEQQLQLVLQSGDIELNDIRKADIFLAKGSIDGSGNQDVDIHLGQGEFDLSLCDGSNLNVQGYHVVGTLFLCSGSWDQFFMEGIKKQQESRLPDPIGSYKIQVASGSLKVLSDPVAELSK